MRRAFIPLLVIVLAIGHCIQASNADALIAAANQLYDRWSGAFDYAAYQDDLESAIELYEQALDALADDDMDARSTVLVRLSRACFELGEGYLTDSKEVEAIHRLGRDYALAALRIDPDFVSTEQGSFRAALSSAKDVGAIFWYGNTLGRFLEFHRVTAIMGGVRDIQACFERAVELDPTYMDGGPLRSLASFYAQVPGFLGGDMDQAETLFQEAMAVSPTFLESPVNWAEFVLKPRQDWSTFCATLSAVVTRAEDSATMASWPLYSARALERALFLLDDGPCER
ncbi:hypothetical protein IH601_04860 [Candidatus Bipolaricaulota bacterium]|nr:hypothetical protein [Candidatus Bipolaricaulota bacterium]